MKPVALVAFNGEFMCFIHVLLNALDMKSKGREVRIVMEGAATKLVPELAVAGNPLSPLYQKAKDQGLIEGVCRACSNKTGTLEASQGQGLRLLDDMNGHPSLARFLDAGWEVLTF
jgi:hypothetical protein